MLSAIGLKNQSESKRNLRSRESKSLTTQVNKPDIGKETKMPNKEKQKS